MVTTRTTCDSRCYVIYASGIFEVLKRVCTKFCLDNKICVHLLRGDFIYDGGIEFSTVIEMRNSPRHNIQYELMLEKSEELAKTILEESQQKTVLLVGPINTVLFERS